MKKSFLFVLGAALSLSTAQHALAQAKKPPVKTTTKSAAAKPATAKPAAASTAMVDMDLTSSGIPVTLKVPAGTKIILHPDWAMSVRLEAPNFVLALGKKAEDSEKSVPEMMALSKSNFNVMKSGHTQLLADEPLAARGHSTAPDSDDKFMVIVPDEANNTYYMITDSYKDGDYSPFGTKAMDKMWASAKSAKLVTK